MSCIALHVFTCHMLLVAFQTQPSANERNPTNHMTRPPRRSCDWSCGSKQEFKKTLGDMQ